jgi:hypothetical protein
MRRTFTYFSAPLVFFVLVLTLFTPVRKVKADPPPERCEACVAGVQARFDKCLEVTGGTDQRCFDQFNEGIIQCYRNFCEQ